MKNVMKKAWEIAKEGQKKFGGKVKEYFAEALRMAWAIVKNGMDKIKFQIIPAKNGYLFGVLDQEEIKVTRQELVESLTSSYTQVDEVKPVHIAKNKQSGEVYKIYQYTPGKGKFIIEVPGQYHIFENNK